MKKKTFIRTILIGVVIVLSIIIAIGVEIVRYKLNIYNVGRGSEIRVSLSEPHGRKGDVWEISFYGKDTYITCDIYETTQEKRSRSLLTKEQIEILNTHLLRTEFMTWSWKVLRSIWNNQNVIQGDLRLLEDTNPSYTVFERVIYLSSLPTYRVKEGDTLSSIAQHVFEDPKKITEILDVNPYLRDDQIRIGSIIRLPQQ